MSEEHVVIDAAALLDLMIAMDVGPMLDLRLERRVLHAPGHIDAEVSGGLAAMERLGELSAFRALECLDALADAPIERHPVAPLLEGAWQWRAELALPDALYVELARSLGLVLITTDPVIAQAAPSLAQLVGVPAASS